MHSLILYLCFTGQYSPDHCTACDSGTYSGQTGQPLSACQFCPTGTYNPSSAATSRSNCLSCPEGTYGASIGAVECEKCPPGTFQPLLGKRSVGWCESCPVGTYSPTTAARNASTCIRCPPGRTTTTTGATSAAECTPEQCPAGHYVDVASGECRVCPAGSVSSALNAASCTPCAAGQFQSLTGQRTCQYCPAGSFSSETGAVSNASCVHCGLAVVGLAGADRGRCGICPPGAYVGSNGACTNCTSAERCLLGAGLALPELSQLSFSVHPQTVMSGAVVTDPVTRNSMLTPSTQATAARRVQSTKTPHSQVRGRMLASYTPASSSYEAGVYHDIALGVGESVAADPFQLSSGWRYFIAGVVLVISLIPLLLVGHMPGWFRRFLHSIDMFREQYNRGAGEVVVNKPTSTGGACTLILLAVAASLLINLAIQHLTSNIVEITTLMPLEANIQATVYDPAVVDAGLISTAASTYATSTADISIDFTMYSSPDALGCPDLADIATAAAGIWGRRDTETVPPVTHETRTDTTGAQANYSAIQYDGELAASQTDASGGLVRMASMSRIDSASGMRVCELQALCRQCILHPQTNSLSLKAYYSTQVIYWRALSTTGGVGEPLWRGFGQFVEGTRGERLTAVAVELSSVVGATVDAVKGHTGVGYRLQVLDVNTTRLASEQVSPSGDSVAVSVLMSAQQLVLERTVSEKQSLLDFVSAALGLVAGVLGAWSFIYMQWDKVRLRLQPITSRWGKRSSVTEVKPARCDAEPDIDSATAVARSSVSNGGSASAPVEEDLLPPASKKYAGL